MPHAGAGLRSRLQRGLPATAMLFDFDMGQIEFTRHCSIQAPDPGLVLVGPATPAAA